VAAGVYEEGLLLLVLERGEMRGGRREGGLWEIGEEEVSEYE
jgi:hypothetical protein